MFKPMDYKQVTFRIDADAADFVGELLPAYLAEVGFDSFEETSQGIVAYCPADLFDVDTMKKAIMEMPCIEAGKIAFRIADIADRNWNEVWEKTGFEPIEISDDCIIRPSGRQLSKQYRYDIIINPVQSFGTGYHETTRMILRMLLDMPMLDGETVLDMGCGTAVLSILATMRGARKITAIDIDPWSQRNATENIRINGLDNKIEVLLGDASALRSSDCRYSLIMANINRNILLADMAAYVSCLDKGGCLIMSGFYSEDMDMIDRCARESGLSLEEKRTDNNWVAVRYRKL